jgi:hypothetical protein
MLRLSCAPSLVHKAAPRARVRASAAGTPAGATSVPPPSEGTVRAPRAVSSFSFALLAPSTYL